MCSNLSLFTFVANASRQALMAKRQYFDPNGVMWDSDAHWPLMIHVGQVRGRSDEAHYKRYVRYKSKGMAKSAPVSSQPWTARQSPWSNSSWTSPQAAWSNASWNSAWRDRSWSSADWQ